MFITNDNFLALLRDLQKAWNINFCIKNQSKWFYFENIKIDKLDSLIVDFNNHAQNLKIHCLLKIGPNFVGLSVINGNVYVLKKPFQNSVTRLRIICMTPCYCYYVFMRVLLHKSLFPANLYNTHAGCNMQC